MNDLARDVLAEAGLKGTKQVQGAFGRGDGRCAIGVLAESLGVLRCSPWVYLNFDGSDSTAWDLDLDGWDKIRKVYELSPEDEQEIVQANDKLGWDFLTISRKCGNGVQEEVAKEA